MHPQLCREAEKENVPTEWIVWYSTHSIVNELVSLVANFLARMTKATCDENGVLKTKNVKGLAGERISLGARHIAEMNPE